MSGDAETSTFNLRLLNDAANAINNTSKRLVRGVDDTLYVLDQEGGTTTEDVNALGEDLFDFLDEHCFEKDKTLPCILSSRFREAMSLDIFEQTLSRPGPPLRSPNVTTAKAVVPGLIGLRDTIQVMVIYKGIISPTRTEIDKFFERVCDDPKCLRTLYGDNVLPLCVQHPAWFYYPENDDDGNGADSEKDSYITKACIYIQEFEKNPYSTKCALCCIYHRLADSTKCNDDISTTLTLAGAPDEFCVNNAILSAYSMHDINKENEPFKFGDLKFVLDDLGAQVVMLNGTVYR
ncbi:hypothetical protein EGW08_020740 [Elysia chlorotica]|uniref:Uncharacterized protein n=1 Tax=Elysia chlorotica TaxID=188477 RepID=A0A3S1BP47_ELYCH|nr:hypothetical protein EGW08_020740 [Elysia chlorotica]